MLRKNTVFYIKNFFYFLTYLLSYKYFKILILLFVSTTYLNGYILSEKDIIVYKVINSYRIAKQILDISYREKIDPLIVTSVVVSESDGYKFAKSYLGATGLMQLMPITANYILSRTDSNLYKKLSLEPVYLYDEAINLSLGIIHLKAMYDFMGQNWEKALHVYNLSVSMYFNGRRNYKYVNDILKRVEIWKKA